MVKFKADAEGKGLPVDAEGKGIYLISPSTRIF